MTAHLKQSFVHFHSSFMFDLAEKESKMSAGVACVILCAAAIEALVGDIALCLNARNHVVDMLRERSLQARSPFGQKQATFTISAISPLDATEEAVASALRNGTQNKSSGLDLYYTLYLALRGDERDAKKATKAQKAEGRKTLPSGVSELFELRNSIVHRHGSGFLFDDEGGLINEADALPPSLAKLSKVFKIKITDLNRSGWLGLIDTAEVATWSLNVTQDFINAKLQSLPDTDAFYYLKRNAKI